jgi:hypothetical protein
VRNRWIGTLHESECLCACLTGNGTSLSGVLPAATMAVTTLSVVRAVVRSVLTTVGPHDVCPAGCGECCKKGCVL